MTAPPNDPIEAGLAVVDAANASGTTLRLIGGVAVAVHCPGADQSLRRSFGDVDFAAEPHLHATIDDVFQSMGYAPRTAFNSLHGDQRLIFLDVQNGRHVDVFVGDFAMCHRIPLTGRLGADPRTIPLVELLLTKLQVVELNVKDLQDAAALITTHPLGDDDDERINITRLSDLVGADWGLFTTVERNLAKLAAFAADRLPPELHRSVAGSVEHLRGAMADAPKTRAWRMRARVGTRIRWYELPEEP
jgi:hypothetical protein